MRHVFNQYDCFKQFNRVHIYIQKCHSLLHQTTCIFTGFSDWQAECKEPIRFSRPLVNGEFEKAGFFNLFPVFCLSQDRQLRRLCQYFGNRRVWHSLELFDWAAYGRIKSLTECPEIKGCWKLLKILVAGGSHQDIWNIWQKIVQNFWLICCLSSSLFSISLFNPKRHSREHAEKLMNTSDEG